MHNQILKQLVQFLVMFIEFLFAMSLQMSIFTTHK